MRPQPHGVASMAQARTSGWSRRAAWETILLHRGPGLRESHRRGACSRQSCTLLSESPQKPWAASLHQRQCEEGRKAGVHTKCLVSCWGCSLVRDFHHLSHTHKETEAQS